MGDPNTERTFIMIKPDGVQRGLVSKIIKRFETKGFKLVAMKFMWVSFIQCLRMGNFCIVRYITLIVVYNLSDACLFCILYINL